jgi:hypothetical protein
VTGLIEERRGIESFARLLQRDKEKEIPELNPPAE